MKPKCDRCNTELEICYAYDDVWSTDHYACPKCDSTYNIFEFCEFCGFHAPYYLRDHHLTPRSKGGKETARVCETCESFIHKTWSHNQLRDTYNSVESIQSAPEFQKFLNWRRKQDASTLFRSKTGKNRDKRKYS